MGTRLRARVARLAAALALALASGCDEAEPSIEAEALGSSGGGNGGSGESGGTTEPSDPVPLVSMEAWSMAAASEDPLAQERPATVSCPEAAWGPEWGRLEVQTGACSYFFATQPSLATIEPGDAIELVIFHDRLDAAEPAEGHVALLLDDEVVWERTVAIPTEAAVLEERVVVDGSWPAGARVGLHLHNHGYNAWTLADLAVAPGG